MAGLPGALPRRARLLARGADLGPLIEACGESLAAAPAGASIDRERGGDPALRLVSQAQELRWTRAGIFAIMICIAPTLCPFKLTGPEHCLDSEPGVSR